MKKVPKDERGEFPRNMQRGVLYHRNDIEDIQRRECAIDLTVDMIMIVMRHNLSRILCPR